MWPSSTRGGPCCNAKYIKRDRVRGAPRKCHVGQSADLRLIGRAGAYKCHGDRRQLFGDRGRLLFVQAQVGDEFVHRFVGCRRFDGGGGGVAIFCNQRDFWGKFTFYTIIYNINATPAVATVTCECCPYKKIWLAKQNLNNIYLFCDWPKTRH